MRVNAHLTGKGENGMNKRRSYAAAIALAALLLIAAVFLSFGALINEQISVSTRERIETYAARQKSYISAVLDSRFSLLRSFSMFLGEEIVNDKEQFECLSRSLCEAGDFDHVLFITGDGRYRIDTGASGKGYNDAGRAALLASDASISPPFRAFYQNDELCVLLSVPVEDADGVSVGLLCVSYTAQQFVRLLLQDTYRDEALSMLTDAEGNLLFSSGQKRLYIPEPEDEQERSVVPSSMFFDGVQSQAIRDSMARREDNYYTFGYAGEDYVLVQTPLDHNGWLLFCMVPQQALVSDFAGITRLRHAQIISIMLIITLSSLLMIGMLMRDRRALREENSALSLRAKTDAMTGLLNREATRAIIETALSGGQPGALLLLLDMDNLKDINDTLGHPIGDRAILMLTEQLRAIFPNADAIGRIGGDEFMIFLREAGSEAQARAQLETLRNRLVQASQGKRATLRCSVGGAFARPEEDYDSLYRRADDALYAVKRNGRDGYAFYKDVR